MAISEVAVATWSGGTAYTRVEIYESGRNNSAGWVDVYWWHGTRGTWGGVSGTWDWSRSGIVGGSGSVAAATGTRMIGNGTTRIYCNSNGNYSNQTMAQWLDVFYGQNTASATISIARSPKPPTNNAPTASNVSVISARITASVANHGHGTSSTYNIRYRKQGGSWVERGWGGATWDISGLTPGAVYEMSSVGRNNNGDTASWTTGTYTFTTLPAPNTNAALLGVIGIM